MTREVLAGRYELEERLGSGGMAEVFGATDRVLGRHVAVKILHQRFARDATYVARFRREARAAAALNHRNVVAVYDSGEDDGTKYIVMEAVRGRTLKEMIAEEAPVPPERTVQIAAAVCEGLASAHARGLVHRDIKPANIMLAEDGEVKVMDFGIARGTTAETVTATALVMGTAAYISPEQARGERVDARSDQYSLGCVLYEMLTGEPPFTGDSAVAVAARHVQEAPRPIEERNPDAPPALAAVVLRLLEKDPNRRFPAAEAARRALIAEGPPPTTPLPPRGGDTAVLPAQPPGRPPRRGRFLALLAVLALLGFVAAWAVRSAGRIPAPVGDPGAEAQEGAPEESPSPDEEAPVDLNPEQAYLALLGVLQEGVVAGEVSDKAAEEIDDRAQKAVEEHRDGDVEDALEEVGKLREKVLDRTPQDIHPARAEAILQAAEGLEAAIREHRSPQQEEDDDDSNDDDTDDTGRGQDRGGGPPGGSPPGQG